jgi:hypothetical protein
MSSMTLVQIVENPITVAIEDATSSFTDNRQGRRPEAFRNQPFLFASLCRPNRMGAPNLPVCIRIGLLRP